MKNPFKVAKKGYYHVLLINDVIERQNKLEQQLQNLSMAVQDIRNCAQEFQTSLAMQRKLNELYFSVLFGKNHESGEDLSRRFLSSIPCASGDLRVYQLGNVKLTRVFVNLCKKHRLPYFIQSGTMLGAVRHQGFVPWDDDTDVAMMRDDIKTLRNILKDDPNYTIALVYDYYNKSRQLRFRTTNPDNPCFLDVYIYDYGDDDSEEAWQKWHRQKEAIVADFEKANPSLIKKWSELGLIQENSP